MSIEIRKIVRESILVLTVGIAVFASTILLRYAIIPQINLLRSNVLQYNTINSLISSESGLTKVIDEIKSKK